jgi:acetoin utilization deacetylase AcuC-like enzyme
MRLTTAALGAMTAAVRGVAEECCRGRLVAVTEGGYDLQALAGSLDAAVTALDGAAVAPHWPSSGIASTRGRESADAAVHALRAFWQIA